MGEICAKLVINTPEWRHWRLSAVFDINFESCASLFFNKVADLRPAILSKRDSGTGVVFVFPGLTLNKQMPTRSFLLDYT